MNYNPYDLVTLRIGGEEIQGRPYEFDSQPANQMTMENEFGGIVKPTHISTVCPKCGQGINIENIELPDPPFPVIDWICCHCNPNAAPPVNAFMNPLQSGRVAEHELDPLLHDPDQQVVVADSTVAERLASDETVTSAKPAKPAKKKTAKSAKSAKKAKKTAKKKTAKKAGKRSPIKGAKTTSITTEGQEKVKETTSLVMETRSAVEKEKADGLKPEFDDDDLVEDE
jgi:hypothetical protein